MKRIVIMLLIACSAITTASADQSANPQKKPETVIATLNAIIQKFGQNGGQVYSVNRNPNTGITESSTKIIPFCCPANDMRNDNVLKAVAMNFPKDEPLAYQFLHIQPGSSEYFMLKVITNNGEQNSTLPIRTRKTQEMWLMCCKNPENPQLRDAYAITWEYMHDQQNQVLGTVYMITSLRPDIYEKSTESSKRMFKIVGRVDENIKDSLYNIYIADSHEALSNLKDHEYVACVPVINKRFEWQTELDRPCVGRLRCIFPDGSLCSAWIDLDFVPGETYSITVHDGYYDEDRDYERRVGRNSGKSLLNKRPTAEADVVQVEEPSTIVLDESDNPQADEPDDWQKMLTPQQKAQLEMKGEAIKMNIDLIKVTFTNAGEGLKQSAECVGGLMGADGTIVVDNTYEQLHTQNKALDKQIQEMIKLAKDYNVPTKKLVDLYKGILKFYTEQNQAFTAMMAARAAQTKQAKKTQKYVHDLTEKYMNEMMKAMQ